MNNWMLLKTLVRTIPSCNHKAGLLAITSVLVCVAWFLRYTGYNNTRQGYARQSILKLAGYSFLGA